MVVVDIDHPDIEFIHWKVHEEQKVAALVAGSKSIAFHLKNVLSHATIVNHQQRTVSHQVQMSNLKNAIKSAKVSHIQRANIQRIIQFARQGYKRH